MPKYGSDERAFLRRAIRRLRPLLAEYGFVYEPDQQGVSSGGSFATGHFRCGKLEIGLIVRHKNCLGCPNYSEGRGYAAHEDLCWALGREDDNWLIPGEFKYYAKDRGDPIRALRRDLKDVILPAFKKSPSDFSKALARAHRVHLAGMSGRVSQRDKEKTAGKSTEAEAKPKKKRAGEG